MSIVTSIEVYDRVAHVEALKDEIQVLKSRFEDHETGHLKTAVSVLEGRVKELESWIVQNY
jgi:ubiquinone biosynthesis protein UbiJ